MEICIPSWQHKFHITTEILSLMTIPILWSAANKIETNGFYRFFLKALAVAIVIVDGGLVLRWAQMKFSR
jgi:hypothetical protein